jgi:hypothetical protein
MRVYGRYPTLGTGIGPQQECGIERQAPER